MRALAAAHNAPMPVVDIAYQHLLTARALHAAQGEGATHKVLDWAAMVAGNRVAAGLDGLDSAKVRVLAAARGAKGADGAARILRRSPARTECADGPGTGAVLALCIVLCVTVPNQYS